MKQLFAIVLLIFGTASLAVAGDYRELESSRSIAGAQSLHVDFHSGDLQIEAGASGKVEIEVELECKWDRRDCEDLLEDVDIDWRSSDRRLYLEVEGLASWRRTKIEVNATVKLPKGTKLFVEMGAGRLTVDGLSNDVRVDMGAGEIRVWMLEAEVETVSVDVGVGDAKFRGRNDYLSGRRSLLIGSELYWDDGSGKARVDVELGAGDATVWLD